jgi:hypothetical protein
MRIRQWVLLVALCGACSNSGGLGSGSPPDLAMAPPQPDLASPPQPVTITGFRGANYVTDASEQVVGFDIRNTTIEALVPDGTGGFTSHVGLGAADGSFTIPNVPPGLNYVHYNGWLYVLTSSTNVDLGYDTMGRSTQKLAQHPTPLVFNVTGLDPWQSGDSTEFHSQNAGAEFFCIQCQATNGPLAGDTALNGLQVDYTTAGYPVLLDAAQGDVPVLYQLVAATNGSAFNYRALAKMASFPPITLQDGVAATLTGAFASFPQTGMLTLGLWQRSAFEQLRPLANGAAMSGRHFLGISAQPRGLSHGTLLRPVDVVESNGGGLDITVGQVAFGNPFPSWSLFGVASVSFAVSYALPARKPLTQYAEAWFEDEATSFAAATLQPGIAPPAHPTLNGQDALVSQTLTTPVTLAWGAPSLGTATIYHAYLYQLIDQQGTTARNYVAEFHTAEATQFAIPKGVLMPGQSYFFQLYAENVTGVDGASHPLRRAFPRTGAALLTGMFNIQQ